MPGKIQNLQLVSRGGRDLGDFAPAAGDAVQQNKKCYGASGEVEQQLRDIGPNYRFHAAFEGVEHSERDDDDHRELLRRSEHDAYNQRDGRDAHAFGNRPRDQKSAGGDGAHAFTEALFDQRVGREKFAAKISGQQQQYDEHTTDQEDEDELKKTEITAVSDGGRADDREGGGFCGDDRKRQGPPRRGAAAQKIVRGVLLAAAETHPQRGNAEQIGNDNGKVERMDSHRESFPPLPLDAAESASRIVAGCSRVKKTLRDADGITTPNELFRFAHSRHTRRYDWRAFSHILFSCATFWDLTAAARRRSGC